MTIEPRRPGQEVRQVSAGRRQLRLRLQRLQGRNPPNLRGTAGKAHATSWHRLLPVDALLARDLLVVWSLTRRALPFACRSLFGRPSKEEMDAFWLANKSRFSSDFRSKWSFDPESSRAYTQLAVPRRTPNAVVSPPR